MKPLTTNPNSHGFDYVDEYEVIGIHDTSYTERLTNGEVVILQKPILNIIQLIPKEPKCPY